MHSLSGSHNMKWNLNKNVKQIISELFQGF